MIISSFLIAVPAMRNGLFCKTIVCVELTASKLDRTIIKTVANPNDDDTEKVNAYRYV